MRSYWITFEDGSKGSCNGESPYDAKIIAEKVSGKKVASGDNAVVGLPYPAAPVVWGFQHPVYGQTPTFCHTPEKCKGNTSCTHRYSCTE